MLPERETIGPDECPLFYRWTLLAPRICGRVPFKVMVHRFLPNRQDADVPHDHPRGFVTFVLRGGYDDLVPCPRCNGRRYLDDALAGVLDRCPVFDCPGCGARGLVLGDRLSAPAVRRRSADHAHMTRTDDRGAWTVVVMGPERRPWGFWRFGRWWGFREFEQRFGFAWRCAEPDEGLRFAKTPEPTS